MKAVANLCLGLCLAVLASPALGSEPQLTIRQEMPLRFGTLVVFGQGSRTVSASGEVSNSGVYPVGLSAGGPARFTVTYDRGSQPLREISVTYMIMLGSIGPTNHAGLNGSLSDFDSDITGAGTIIPGRSVIQTMTNCFSQTCSATFHIGARLNMSRASGGGPLTFALPITAKLISVQSL